MTRPLIELLETRQFLSATLAGVGAPVGLATSAIVMAPAATSPTVVAPTLGASYAGKYTIGSVKKNITVVFDKAYSGGVYATTVTDAGVKYSGNALLSGNLLTLNWFTLAADQSQVPVGTINGTLDTTFGTITGPITRQGLTGTATLTRKDPPLVQQDYTYVGTYTIAGVSHKISIKLVKSWGFAVYINVLDGGKLYDGNMYSSAGVTYINWFKYDASYNQIPVGTITGSFTADGTTFYGTVLKGKKTGTAMFTLVGVAPSPQVP